MKSHVTIISAPYVPEHVDNHGLCKLILSRQMVFKLTALVGVLRRNGLTSARLPFDADSRMKVWRQMPMPVEADIVTEQAQEQLDADTIEWGDRQHERIAAGDCREVVPEGEFETAFDDPVLCVTARGDVFAHWLPDNGGSREICESESVAIHEILGKLAREPI